MLEGQPVHHMQEPLPIVRPVVKVTANLPVDVYNTLANTANKRGISGTEFLRQAISTEHFLMKAEQRGDKVILEDRDGTRWHVDFGYRDTRYDGFRGGLRKLFRR